MQSDIKSQKTKYASRLPNFVQCRISKKAQFIESKLYFLQHINLIIKSNNVITYTNPSFGTLFVVKRHFIFHNFDIRNDSPEIRRD